MKSIKTGIELPPKLIAKIYNEIDGEDLKKEIIAALSKQAETNPRDHKIRGFYYDSVGKLHFSEELYDHAVYCGKTGTYSKSVHEKAKELKRAIEMLKNMQTEKLKFANIVQKLGVERAIDIHEALEQEELQAAQSIRAMLNDDTSVEILAKIDLPENN